MNFDSLKDQISNLTLYDVKASVRQLQNAVMNYTEMEAKVREATNNEPWGASSSIMQEIASGTFNYQLLNEIMPMIYHRFTEKTAEQWRQIYKGLQLLEFLIKNGSERVIDDARSHMSLLKMLRQFHFIDNNGKDQGINVRNRSKELVELLSDVEKIRQERKKARANRNKYGGYEGGGGGLGGPSGPRFGGFGSESGGSGGGANYGGYDGRVYGDGGGFGGQSSDYQDGGSKGADGFEEYDENEDSTGAGASSSRRTAASLSASRPPKKAEPPKPKEPEVDLFDFGDEPITTSSTSAGKAPAASSGLDILGGGTPAAADDDDDFDDFQSAPTTAPAPTQPSGGFSIAPPASTTTTLAAPQPVSGTQNQNLNDLFSSVSPPPRANTTSASTPQARAAPSGFQQPTPNYFTSVPNASNSPAASTRSNISTTPGGLGKPLAKPGTIGGGIGGGAKPSGGGDAFAGLLGGMGAKKPATPVGKVSMADMARQKASAGIWGPSSSNASTPAPQGGQQQQKTGGALDDLLG